MKQNIIEVKNLKTYFPIAKNTIVHAVDDISLSIDQGEVIGLVGESGSGKSTLGKTLIGLCDKTQGRVLYKNETLPSHYRSTDFKRYAGDIQMIFQDPYSSLNPQMTVMEILREPLIIQGKSLGRDKDQSLIIEWLEKVGLKASHITRYPHEFSGGQRQRLGIARALIVEPKFVVCDEPISALDVSVQAQVINLLAELKQSMDLTLVFIAHDLSMVRYISDRIVVMYMGAMVEAGPADDVFFDPKHPYTQLLIESNPIADPKQEKQRNHIPIHGEVSSPINIQPGCRFVKRCPKAKLDCHSITPKMSKDKDRIIACHLF